MKKKEKAYIMRCPLLECLGEEPTCPLLQEDAVGVVEIILILVVLIALVLIFKDKLTSLVNTIFTNITTKAKSVYS